MRDSQVKTRVKWRQNWDHQTNWAVVIWDWRIEEFSRENTTETKIKLKFGTVSHICEGEGLASDETNQMKTSWNGDEEFSKETTV